MFQGISRVLHFLSCFRALIQRTFSLGLTPPSSYYWVLSSELHWLSKSWVPVPRRPLWPSSTSIWLGGSWAVLTGRFLDELWTLMSSWQTSGVLQPCRGHVCRFRHANGSLMAQTSQYRLPETDVGVPAIKPSSVLFQHLGVSDQ